MTHRPFCVVALIVTLAALSGGAIDADEPQRHRPAFPSFFDDRPTPPAAEDAAEGGLEQAKHSFFSAAAHRGRFVNAAATLCDPNDGLSCGSHGQCVANIGCVCAKETSKGFWAGDDCDQCDNGWAGSDCRVECKGGSCNECNGHGTCNTGTAGDGTCTCFEDPASGFWAGEACSDCKVSYYGVKCDQSCPGTNVGQAVCFGRGVCRNDVFGSGTCTCDEGWGSDSGCEFCDASHFGDNCLAKCNGYVAATRQPCAGHGMCFNGTARNGTCVCDSGWGSFDCSRQCPSEGPTTAAVRCSGHGMCLDGAVRDASCDCNLNFAKPDCANCTANRTGIDCDLTCPVNEGTRRICSDRGKCRPDDTATPPVAFCECVPGYYSSAGNNTCESSCGGSPPCSGHGYCNASGAAPVCHCFSDATHGHWTGALCDTCDERYNQSVGCRAACPMSGDPLQICGGHGYCAQGRCFCFRERIYEYCGTDDQPLGCARQSKTNCGSDCPCEYCKKKYFGSFCHLKCPGFIPTDPPLACSGHGYCDEGRKGTGLCTCDDGYAGLDCALTCPADADGNSCSGIGHGRCVARGLAVGGGAYCDCSPQFAGDRCGIECPTIGGEVCSGHGYCDRNNATHTGAGTCDCTAGWTGLGCNVPCACDSEHGHCDLGVCANYTSYETCTTCICNGNFSAPGLCKECISGTQGLGCDGVCAHGTTVGRNCECEPNWSTPSCDVFCPVDRSNVICGGHGHCVANAKVTAACNCEPAGAPEWFRANCTQLCTVAQCKLSLRHPQCNPSTGDCECLDAASGHWAGPQCDVCKQGYWGSQCTEACQCNDHGSCDMNNGECECFGDALRGYYTGTYCESCRSGFIGENCERRNVLITRLPPSNTTSTAENSLPPGLQASAPSTSPTPQLLNVDGYSHTLYAGGVPTFKYDISGTKFAEILATPDSTRNQTGMHQGNETWALCNTEVAFVRPHQDELYYVVQPSAWCDTPLRIYEDSGRQKTHAPLHFSATPWWQWTVNTTVRVVAVSATGDYYYYGVGGGGINAEPLGFAILLAQFSALGGSGVQYPGGFVIYVRGKDQAIQLPLPNHFFATDIALAKPETSGAKQTITVSGTVDGRWELLVFREEDGILEFVPKYQTANPTDFSVFSLIECWPSSTSAPTATCSGCLSVLKVEFLEQSIVAVMQGEDANKQITTSVAWIQARADLRDGQTVAARINSVCTMARYRASSSTLVAIGTGVETSAFPKLFVAVGRTNEVDAAVSSLALDPLGKVAYICMSFTSGNTPSVLAKFSLIVDNFSVYGKRQLDYVPTVTKQSKPEVFSQMVIDSDARILYGLVTGIVKLRIVQFLLYEVQTLTPNIVDQRGGVINVTGLGFQQVFINRTLETRYPIKCQFGGGDIVEATNVTFNWLLCGITVVDNTTASSCSGQTVEVSLYGNTRFTETMVAVKRIQSARITPPVSPDRGSLGGGTLITIDGQSFVNSPYALCKFFSANSEVLYSPLTFVNPNRATCVQPLAQLPSYGDSFLDVSLDSQSYTEAGPAPYQIVGAASNLSSPVSQQERAVDNTTMTAAVFVVDERGHQLLRLDAETRTVCLFPNVTIHGQCDEASFSWWSAHDFPYSPCRNNTLNVTDGELCREAVNGKVTFDNIVIYKPRTAAFDVQWYIVGHPWTATTTVTVIEGTAHALALENRNTFVVDPFFKQDGALKALDVVVIDSLGNILTQPDRSVIVTARPYYVMDSNGDVVVSGSPPTAQMKPDSNKVIFGAIFLKFVHGANHFINFTSQNPTLQGTTSPALRTTPCDNRAFFYKVPNSSQCLPCPPEGAVCDGSETIEVKKGFWRGNTTTFIYSCPAGIGVCLGSTNDTGSTCAEGYKGELCAVCDEGYGKVGATSCTTCEALWLNAVVVSLAAAVFFGGLLAWSSISLRTAEVTDVSVILRTVLNHLQATGQLGEFSTQWNPFLKSLFDIQSSGSSFSIGGLSAVDCLLRSTGNDALTVFLAYMSLPVVAVVMAFGVFVVVRILKLEPIISDDLRDEIMEDIKNFGTPSTMQLLFQYPFYMVVTTTLSVILFASYQTLITQSTTVLQCNTLMVADNDERSFLELDMSVNCADGRYNTYRTIAMLCAIGYGLGIPLMFVFSFNFVNGRIGKPALTQMMFLFLIGGYKHDYWFWQAIIMVRKLALVCVVVFIRDNSQLQSYCGMWTMSIALIVQIWFEPNEKDEHNLVEALSLAIITVTLNLGLLYFWPDMPSSGKDALTAILLAITFGAGCMFGYFLYGPVRDTIMEKLHMVRDVATDLHKKAKNLNQDDTKPTRTLRGLVGREEDDQSSDEDVVLHRSRGGHGIRHSRYHDEAAASPEFAELEMRSMGVSSPRTVGPGSPRNLGSPFDGSYAPPVLPRREQQQEDIDIL